VCPPTRRHPRLANTREGPRAGQDACIVGIAVLKANAVDALAFVPERHSRGRQSLDLESELWRGSGGLSVDFRVADRPSVSGPVDRRALALTSQEARVRPFGGSVLGLTIANRVGPRRCRAHERTAAQC
jgi:hypothetical protein